MIYLYPERTTDVTVRIRLTDGRFTMCIPEGDGEWNVTASPDGTLTDKATGKTYQPKELLVMFGEDADISPYDYANYIAGNYSVSTWSASVDSRLSFSNTMERMNYIIVLVVSCAAALAFIVLFNLNNINITERIREIATLKVMGFYRNGSC